MAILKCKMCGGDLNVTEGMSVCKCDYCDTKQTVPVADDEKKLNLFNRATRLRIGGEFDKASALYESLVAEFPEEAEAYWGLVICHYGIEYVCDPATGNRIPTCHRASFDPIANNENFRMAMEYADMAAQKVYRNEAREIDRIREEILLVGKDEKPYDIFICYKESDDQGQRTVDSVIAQNVYDVLTDRGYRVFFARISLEDKLGSQYEPYIFSALNSARIMLVVGTDYDRFHAVWVKNEWSRFLKLMALDKNKALIPCYKDMDVYDMPDEFHALQAQDMGKVGAMQDLLRGIEKIMGSVKTVRQQPTAPFAAATADNVAPLLKRAFMFLEDGDWDSADEYCEKVLDLDPECAEAYLGKLMVELRICRRKDFKKQRQPFDKHNFYQKAFRFGDAKLRIELKGYNRFIIERNLMAKYDAVVKMMENAQTPLEWKNVADAFGRLGDFKDAAHLETQCRIKSEEVRKEMVYKRALQERQQGTCETLRNAEELFRSIVDWKDAAQLAKECQRQLLDIETAKKDALYNQYVKDMQGGTTDSLHRAIRGFQGLINWRDADTLMKKCQQQLLDIETAKKDALYNRYVEDMKDNTIGSLRRAQFGFQGLINWRDAADKYRECQRRLEQLRKKEEEKEQDKRNRTSLLVDIVFATLLISVVVLGIMFME